MNPPFNKMIFNKGENIKQTAKRINFHYSQEYGKRYDEN